jgi:polysaccharide biosynthesis protein PslG
MDGSADIRPRARAEVVIRRPGAEGRPVPVRSLPVAALLAVLAALAVAGPAMARTDARNDGRRAKDAGKARTRATARPPAVSVADRVGVSSHFFWLGRGDAVSRMGQLRAAGVRWLRDDFNWDRIQPTPGQFDWARTDNLMAAASETGMQVLGVLTYSPAWASSDPTGGGRRQFGPSDPAAYARFAAAVTDRYGRGGAFWAEHPELDPQPLRAIEVWNEPHGHWSWGTPDPAAYAALFRATVSAVEPRREVRVLLSADNLQVRQDRAIRPWFTEVVRADPGVLRLADGLAVHPYPQPWFRGPNDRSSDPRWRFERATAPTATARVRGVRLPVWITEVGWSTEPSADGSVDEATQARFIREAVLRVTGEWAGSVARMFLYTYGDNPDEANPLHRGYGLRRADGSPKPAWDALSALLRSS